MSRVYARNHLSGTPTGLPLVLTEAWQTLHTATNALDSDDEVYLTGQNPSATAVAAVQVRIGGTAVMRFFLGTGQLAQLLPGALLRGGLLVEARLEGGAGVVAFGYINELRPA